jgi:hypothetical protein
MKRVLIFAAVAEIATGMALLTVPSLVGQLLLGERTWPTQFFGCFSLAMVMALTHSDTALRLVCDFHSNLVPGK